MSGGFSFPPPPPPPPKPVPPNQEPRGPGHFNNPGNQNLHARGGSRGGQRGYGQRGRGNSFANRGSHQQHSGGSYGTLGSRQTNGTTPDSGLTRDPDPHGPERHSGSNIVGSQPDQTTASFPRTAAGHKRKLDALRPPPDQKKKSGPPTAPSIPSFGTPIIPAKPQQPSENTSAKPKQPTGKPGRSIGLTPGTNGDPTTYSDSEDDNVDEEALYAELGNKLTFEHNGVVLSLNSQADLIAWKKERQRNWPTKARMAEKNEERRRVGAERKRLLRGGATTHVSMQKPQQNKASKDSQEVRPQSDDDGTPKTQTSKSHPTERARRLDELRKKALESSTKNREVITPRDDNREAVESEKPTLDAVMEPPEEFRSEAAKRNQNRVPEASENGSEESSAESSGSGSESESDSAPEEVTSKPLEAHTTEHPTRPCKFFTASGYCRDGNACRFKHEQSAQSRQTQNQFKQEPQISRQENQQRREVAPGKKGIFERMKEQEQEQEDRLALQVIKYLGGIGFFLESSFMDT